MAATAKTIDERIQIATKREWPFSDYFVSYGVEGQFKPLRRNDTLFKFAEGIVEFSDGTTDDLRPRLNEIPGKPPLLQSIQLWGDTHYRFALQLDGERLGWMRGSGLTYTKVWDVKFNEILVRELAMPPVLSFTAGTSPRPILDTQNVPLFQNRFADGTIDQDTFTTSNTGADVMEFRQVVSFTITPLGTGRQTLHVSGIHLKNFLIQNTSANDALVRLRGNYVEGKTFFTDPVTPVDGFLIAGNQTVLLTTDTDWHRIILQAIRRVAGANATLEVQYWGTNIA